MLKPVVSASRRIDMVATCPERLVSILAGRFPPEKTHTLVIWTKDPARLLSNPDLRTQVGDYPSVFVHVTITGMGGSVLEPKAPGAEESLDALEDLAQLVSGPEHLALRFDPIVHLRLPNEVVYSNLHHFEPVAGRAAGVGIRRVIVSWMQRYRKVERRLARVGVEAVEPAPAERDSEAEHLRRVVDGLGVEVRGCCVPGWPRGACIDGSLFRQIHPAGERCSRAKATGQREHCGCTRSVDIGWYGPCVHGCLYCYANPRFYGASAGEWGSGDRAPS